MRRKSTLGCLLGSMVWTGVAAGTRAADFETPTAITGVRVVTGEGTTFDSATILFRDGVIQGVGPSLDIPGGSEIIDGSGLHAYPGFIDAHSFAGMPAKERSAEERKRTEDETADPRQDAPSETDLAPRRGVRPQVRARDLVEVSGDAQDKHRKAGFAAALVAPRSGIFAGTSDLISFSGLPLRRSLLATDLGQHSAFTTGEPGEYPATLLGVFAQFRQALLDARWYEAMKAHAGRQPGKPAADVPSDVALEALGRLIAGRTPLIFEANSEDEIRRALDLAGEFGIKPTISGAREAFKLIEPLKSEPVPVIVSLKWPDEPEEPKPRKPRGEPDPVPATQPDQPPETQPAATQPAQAAAELSDEERIWEPAKLRKERRRLWEEQVDNAIRLHEAGIAFALTTREFDNAADFSKNLSKLVSRGLPADAALAALTTTPAKMLGLERKLGSIAPGKLANVVLLSRPLGDEKAKVAYLFVEGRKFKYEVDKDKEEKNEKKKKPDEDEATTKPTTTTAAEEPDGGPTWRCEIEADRVPKLRTGGSILIRNATLYPVTAPPIESASLLIEKGRIKALGRNVSAAAGVTEFDATGLHVLPGFVDAHSHMAIDGVNEAALAISAEVRIRDVVTSKEVAMYRALAAGMTAMHSMHGSANPIGGQNVTLKLKYNRPPEEMIVASAPRTIKFALGENVTQANRGGRGPATRFPSTRMGVESVLRRALAEAGEYRRERADYERRSAAGEDLPPPRTDLRLEALAEVLEGTLQVHCHGYRADEYLRLLDVFEDHGVRVAVLQHILEGYRIAPEIARHGCGGSTFSSSWAYKLEAYEATTYNIALMADYGINVSINSDSPDIARHFNTEFHKPMRWGGMSEAEALKLVTLNPAQQLGIADRVGSLEVGKDGDLAIFNGPPGNSFSRCVMTLIEGEVYFQAETMTPAPPALRENRRTGEQVSRKAEDLLRNPRGVYAITGATVHPISGPTVENATVVIRDGKIAAVGAAAAVPAEATVIEARGFHVYPGLIDCGSVLGLTEIDMIRATRDLRDIADFMPDLAALSAVNPHSAHFANTRTAGVTSALSQPSGGHIAGQSSHIRLAGWTAPEMAVQDAWALHVSLPSLPVHLEKKEKEERTKTHKETMEAIEEFFGRARRYAEVRGQKSEVRGQETTHRSALTTHALLLEAMIPYVRGEKPVVFAAGRYKPMVEAIEFAEKHGLKCVIGGGEEAWKLADVLASKKIPVILGTPRSLPSGEFEPYDSVYACAGVLEAAGVEYAFASENAAEAYELPFQVASAVAHGLDPEHALYRLTLGAAKLLEVGERLGSIEVGKDADLIVTTGSPIQGATQVAYMFIAGEPVSLSSKHSESYEKFKARPSPKLPPLLHLKGPPSLTAVGATRVEGISRGRRAN